MKTIPDKIKNEAYIIYSEFGSMVAVPREERLSECFPEVQVQVRKSWIQEFEEVNKSIWKFAEQGGPKIYTQDKFNQSFSEIFLWMDNESLARSWSRMCYYAWHEGYEK